MFVVIPIGTDAPVYHYPFATIGVMFTNLICFVASGFGDPTRCDNWILWFGDGLHPVQWLTTNYLHAGFGHLIGNMIFLWIFGLITEGKLGWWRFLLAYHAIGIAYAVCIQTLMLIVPGPSMIEGHHVGALGASAAIMGLLSMCLVWAPKNEIRFFVWFFLTVARVLDFSVIAVAAWYFGWDLFIALVTGLSMGTSMLHLTGAAMGFGVGVLLFKTGQVDCEDWDLFSVMSGHYGPFARDRYGYKIEKGQTKWDNKDYVSQTPEKPDLTAETAENLATGQLGFIAGLIQGGEFTSAAEELFQLRLQHPEQQLHPKQLKELCKGLVSDRDYDNAEVCLEDMLAQNSSEANWARLQLASLLLKVRKRPRATMLVLKHVDREQLTPSTTKAFKQLAEVAREQIRSGVQDQEQEW